MRERPVRDRPRRPADWLNLAGDKKVHSSEEQVSRRKGLAVARFRSADLNQATRGGGSRLRREPFTRCELGSARLPSPSPSLNLHLRCAFVKAGCGKEQPTRPESSRCESSRDNCPDRSRSDTTSRPV